MEYASENSDIRSVVSQSPRETINIGRQIGKKVEEGSVVCLYGELGSGKTTLVKGIAKELEVTEEIISPSYLLVRKYTGKISLIHIDLFRVDSDREVMEVGMDDYLIDPDGIVVIEWAGRIENLLPEDKIVVQLEFKGQKERKILIKTPFESL